MKDYYFVRQFQATPEEITEIIRRVRRRQKIETLERIWRIK